MQENNNNTLQISKDIEASLKAIGERNKRADWLSHPFVITVIGGLMIAIIGALLQHYNYKNQQKLFREQQFQKKKYSLLAGFSEPFKKYMFLLYNIRLNQIYLKKSKTGEKDFIGRTREEVNVIYKDLTDELLKSSRGEATLVSVRALYSSKDVIGCLDVLDNQVLSMQNDDLSEPGLLELNNRIEHSWRKLAIAMQKEVALKPK